MNIANFLFPAKSKPAEDKTQDDTFEALCRIPRAQLEKNLSHICDFIEHNERRRHLEDKIKRNQLAYYKIKRVLGFPFGIHPIIPTIFRLSVPQEDIILLYGREFNGTGWTVEKYCDAVYADAEKEEQKAISTARKKFFTLSSLFILLAIGNAFAIPHLSSQLAIIIPVLTGCMTGLFYLKIANDIDNKDLRESENK